MHSAKFCGKLSTRFPQVVHRLCTGYPQFETARAGSLSGGGVDRLRAVAVHAFKSSARLIYRVL